MLPLQNVLMPFLLISSYYHNSVMGVTLYQLVQCTYIWIKCWGRKQHNGHSIPGYEEPTPMVGLSPVAENMPGCQAEHQGQGPAR